MAKLSKINKNELRIKLVQKYLAKRIELKEKIRSANSTDEERDSAWKALRNLPKDSNPVRIRSRCSFSGRPRAIYKKFGLSRIAFRDFANRGLIPGVIKASW